MEVLIDNWYVVVGVLSVIGVVMYAGVKFLGLPTKQQIEKIREWLLWAVCVAEEELGSDTGKLKLRYVWDMFIEKFPMTAKFISFETFSKLVDDALEEMKEMLDKNPAVARLILRDDIDVR